MQFKIIGSRTLAASLFLAAGLAGTADAATRAGTDVRSSHGRAGHSATLRLADVDDDDTAGNRLNARERKKKCESQWRGFSAAEKTAQGPKWPQFYNRCIKRLKASSG